MRARILLHVAVAVLLLSAVVPAVAEESPAAEEPPCFLLSWGSYGSGEGEFAHINGLAVDSSDNVYVTDLFNSRVQKFTSDGDFITSWGGLGTGDGQFHRANGVAVDGYDNIYVADQRNHRVQKFTSDGDFITKWGSYGTGEGEFVSPFAIAIHSSGDVFVAQWADDRVVQRFSSDGDFITSWGTYGSGDGQFARGSWGIEFDDSDDLYAADNHNHRVQKFTGDGTFLTKWGSYGTGPGQFSYPSSVEIDSFGFVYVADNANNRVQKFGPCTPDVLITNLIDQVTGLNLDNGISNSLDAKLANAVKALDDVNENNNVAAINKLEAFINEVQAQGGNKIPQADADALIAAVQQIIDLLMR